MPRPAPAEFIVEFLINELQHLPPSKHIRIFDALAEIMPTANARLQAAKAAQHFRDAEKLETKILDDLIGEMIKTAKLRSARPGQN